MRDGDDDSGRFKRREAKTRMHRNEDVQETKDQTRSTGEYDADVNVNAQYGYKNEMKGKKCLMGWIDFVREYFG